MVTVHSQAAKSPDGRGNVRPPSRVRAIGALKYCILYVC